MIIRKATPEDAGELIDMFKTVYSARHGQTKADIVEKDLKNPGMLSLVAVEDGRIVGHGQLRPPEYPFSRHENDGVELARLGVHRDYQHRGIGRQLVQALTEIIEARSPGFVFSDFNTSTDYSQRVMRDLELKPIALLLALGPDYAGIGQSNSFLVGMKVREDAKDQQIVYVPSKYRELAESVYDSLGLKRDIREAAGDADISNFEKYLAQHLFYSMFEKDSNPYLLLIDVSRPGTSKRVRLAEKLGLRVEGLVPLVREPDGTRSDKLIMSKVPELDPSKIKVYSDLYERFVKLVLNRGNK